MHAALRWLKHALLGEESPPRLEEDRFPLNADGRPDLARFTQSVAYYARYIDDYLESLDPRGSRHPATSKWQSYAYRKGVFGQWGLIARGPVEALPTVLGLLRHPVAEGRQAGAGVLGAWARDGVDVVAPSLAAAERELNRPEIDIETLGSLIGVLGRARSEAALPLLARALRAPESTTGDLDWSAMEALQDIAGQRFVDQSDPKKAAERWLRERGM